MAERYKPKEARADEEPTDEEKKARKEELEKQFVEPATLANKAYVTVGPAGVILTFSENISADVTPVPRVRVVMPYSDAIAFAGVLERMLGPLKEALANAPEVEVENPKNG